MSIVTCSFLAIRNRSSVCGFFALTFALGAIVSDTSGASLVGFHSAKCLQVEGTPGNGSPVVQATCTGGGDQQWELRPININSQYLIVFNTPGHSYMLQVNNNRELVISDHTLEYLSDVWDARQEKSKNGIVYSSWKNESVAA